MQATGGRPSKELIRLRMLKTKTEGEIRKLERMVEFARGRLRGIDEVITLFEER